ncbi:hypothetical protein QOZ94_002404 [Xanthobacter agilis]|uniref:Uncharacterized protein n=1 Tax=Xanthobacter agilis TaxID=47492 RepID=A0ABU0LEP6_XANAG|nr:hypothetical protein [Xanthobacter agilis]
MVSGLSVFHFAGLPKGAGAELIASKAKPSDPRTAPNHT